LEQSSGSQRPKFWQELRPQCTASQTDRKTNRSHCHANRL